MSSTLSPRKVAVGLLVVSILALIVGIFNAAKIQITHIKAEKSKKSAVASLLNKPDRLAEVTLSGMIVMDSEDKGLFSSDSAAMAARKALDEAAEDESVKGVLLRINSPGGTVAMSQELNRAVQRVSKKKPIVASLGDLAASGGYYTACAADRIIANPGTLTASIGVIISTMNLESLLNNKLGVHAVTIKSGQFKDILSPYRKPTAADLALVQRLVNESYQDFLGAVIAGRTRFVTDEATKTARIAKIKAVADGRIVHGGQALNAELVDEIGDEDHAYTVLDKMAKERFHLRGKDRLPLEPVEGPFNLLEFLGMAPVANRMQQYAQAATTASPYELYGRMLPMSMRYPNQPLWVME